MKQRSVWIIPFCLVIIMIMVLSLRQLSDPDIGSHLRAGKWIVENKSVPGKDTFTYTVNSHDYIDMNWLFQVIVYAVFYISGYTGLSILVMILILALLTVFLYRMKRDKIPLAIISFILLISFLVIEVRITLRPELFTFLFLSLYMIILDDYDHKKNRRLFLLPVIMLFWCNIHGLFILGFGLTGAFFISVLVRDKKVDWSIFFWMIITIAVSFLNPYFAKGVTFPFELFTRFDTSNIFHEHIKELQSFYHLDRLYFKDVMFLLLLFLTLIGLVFTFRKRRFHEFLLFIVFAGLALVSIRNIALFAVMAVPFLSGSLKDISDSVRIRKIPASAFFNSSFLQVILMILMILFPLAVTLRLLTGAYYQDNKEYSKTGVGIDRRQLPEKAAEFMIRERLTGRIINGISLGGWLSWRLPQPVFIDGRLEVIGEELYRELTESWERGLPEMADHYQADIIVYNYLKYFPWTSQLTHNPDWVLRYIDGLTVIFERREEGGEAEDLNRDSLCLVNGVPVFTEPEIRSVLEMKPVSSFRAFLDGFQRRENHSADDLLNIGTFFLQSGHFEVAEKFFLESLKASSGKNRHILYALSDIYRERGDSGKAELCYRRILEFDPENPVLREYLSQSVREAPEHAPGQADDDAAGVEARKRFNEANARLQQGDAAAAMMLYDEAIRLSPGYFKAYNNRAILKASVLKKYEEAIVDFSRAIEIRPGYADAYLGRGSSKFELRDLNGACSDWNKAAALGNKKAVTLIRRYCPLQ